MNGLELINSDFIKTFILLLFSFPFAVLSVWI